MSDEAKPLRWHVTASGPYVLDAWVGHAVLGVDVGVSGGLLIAQAGNLPDEPTYSDAESAERAARKLAGLRLLLTAYELLR